MKQICPNCSKLFDGGDLVKALILTRFVPLKSSITYALEKPTECLAIEHFNCQFPQTGEQNGD